MTVCSVCVLDLTFITVNFSAERRFCLVGPKREYIQDWPRSEGKKIRNNLTQTRGGAYCCVYFLEIYNKEYITHSLYLYRRSLTGSSSAFPAISYICKIPCESPLWYPNIINWETLDGKNNIIQKQDWDLWVAPQVFFFYLRCKRSRVKSTGIYKLWDGVTSYIILPDNIWVYDNSWIGKKGRY